MIDTSSPPLIIPGSASRDLSRRICEHLSVEPGHLTSRRFSDGETFVKIEDNVRGRDVFVVQATQQPTNENLMELLLTLDALRRASADRITAVIPYFGYARQDRKDQGRVALSAKLVANLITIAGADRVLAVDLHAGQLQGFFDIPVDHLVAGPVLVNYIRQNCLENACVVSPDVGNVKLGRDYATQLNVALTIIDKRRSSPNVSEVMAIIGSENVEGRTALIFDDMIDTAGTVCNAARALMEHGAREVFAFATHAVLSGPAIERLQQSPLKKVVATNTISHEPGALSDKIEILDVAPLIAKAIDRIHRHSSVSAIFKE
jgi:ribose-phosphate pyrophosphokinase